MKEIRFHGRGGQGAVTAAQVLAKAAAIDGKYCQAMPSFGVERRGAPVTAFTRIGDEFILRRQSIRHPNYVVVLDPSLLDIVDVTDGIKEDGALMINTEKSKEELGIDFENVKTVDATTIALETFGKPFVNTVMLGALVKTTGIVSLEAVKKAIKERFPGELRDANVKAVEKAYEETK